MTKQKKVPVRPAKTLISLGICPVWSESSLSAWRKLGSLATHWVHSEDSDQTGQMPRLIWVFAGCTVSLLVLSWGGWIICLDWSYSKLKTRDLMHFVFQNVSTKVYLIWAPAWQHHENALCTQISLGICPVWWESSLSAWRNLTSVPSCWAHSKDWSDCADVQADQCLQWAHMSFCWFCHAVAHLCYFHYFC